MHPETTYKLCKFRENRTRDVTLRGIYILEFDKILKFSVFGVLYPYHYIDAVKFGMEQWNFGLLLHQHTEILVETKLPMDN